MYFLYFFFYSTGKVKEDEIIDLLFVPLLIHLLHPSDVHLIGSVFSIGYEGLKLVFKKSLPFFFFFCHLAFRFWLC